MDCVSKRDSGRRRFQSLSLFFLCVVNKFNGVIIHTKCQWHTKGCRGMMMYGNTFLITGPLWGESTGHRWIPLTKDQWCGSLMFMSFWTNSREACEMRCLDSHSTSLWRQSSKCTQYGWLLWCVSDSVLFFNSKPFIELLFTVLHFSWEYRGWFRQTTKHFGVTLCTPDLVPLVPLLQTRQGPI